MTRKVFRLGQCMAGGWITAQAEGTTATFRLRIIQTIHNRRLTEVYLSKIFRVFRVFRGLIHLRFEPGRIAAYYPAPQMSLGSFSRISATICLVLGLIGCEQLEVAHDRATSAIRSFIPPAWYSAGGTWYGDDVRGKPRIVVRLSQQRAYFYKGKHLVGETVVSTGKPGFSTPVGHYRVVRKTRDHVSSAFGDYIDDSRNIVRSNIDVRKDPKPPGTHFDGARMPYCMHFNGGYAMHEGYVPPYAASHGCIRLPKGMARRFFNTARVGTPVVVKN